MATLIGHLVTDYPASRTILGGKTFVFRGRVYARRIPLFDDPGGVQALKTGFTNEAGYNLAIAAWRAGQRFLLIVLGSQTRSLVLPRRAQAPPVRLHRQRPRHRRRPAAALGASAAPRAAALERRHPVRRLAAGPEPGGSRMAAPRAFLFDAYGTLFDVHSVVEAGRAVTSDPQALSALWRQKQLEYTWLRSLMDRYVDFWAVTQSALSFALRRLGLQPSPAQARGADGGLPLARHLPGSEGGARRAGPGPARHPLQRLADGCWRRPCARPGSTGCSST